MAADKFIGSHFYFIHKHLKVSKIIFYISKGFRILNSVTRLKKYAIILKKNIDEDMSVLKINIGNRGNTSATDIFLIRSRLVIISKIIDTAAAQHDTTINPAQLGSTK